MVCSYYFGDLLAMVGISSSTTKQKMNVGYAAWSLVTGAAVAFVVTRFRRRTLYIICTVALLLIYTGWTICFKYAIQAKDAGYINEAASDTSIFFIFAYQPAYNIGFNALTYSKSKSLTFTPLLFQITLTWQIYLLTRF